MNNQQLLEEIRRIWGGPTTTDLATDDTSLLAHADEVMRQELIPEIIDLAESYMLMDEQITLVDGQEFYGIPKRALGSQIEFLSRNENGTPDDIDWISLRQKNRYANTNSNLAYVQGDYIRVVGPESGTLEIVYPLTPGNLVPSSDYREVTNVAGNVVTAASIPPSWALTDTFTIHSPHQAGQPRFLGRSISAIDGTTLTFTGEIAGATFGTRPVVNGDYIVRDGYAAQPQVPEILHGLLAVGVALRIAETQADTELVRTLERRYERNLGRAKKMLDRRVNQKKVLINHNSPFRRGLGGGVRRRRLS